MAQEQLNDAQKIEALRREIEDLRRRLIASENEISELVSRIEELEKTQKKKNPKKS